jgi:hypothetical protein
VAYPPRDTAAHPLVGRRAPDLRLSGGSGLFSLLEPGHHVLIDMAGGRAVAAVGELPGRWQAVVHVDTLAEERAQWQGVRAALVRPDGHVAWAGTEPDDEALGAAATAALTVTGR